MADRKSLFSRFWPPATTRRTSTTTAAPPPASTASAAPPPRAETKAPARQSSTKASSSSPPAPTTPPRTQPRKADQPSSASQPSGEVQKARSPSPSPSPSLATTRSPSSASPSRLSAQSRSPPQPSSPSLVGSQIPSTPKRAPSRVTSRSPKQRLSSSPKEKLPASPSKELTQPTETISTSYEAPALASKQKDPEPATPQQPEMKEEVKHDNVEAKQPQSSEVGTATTPAKAPETDEAINGGQEASTKLDAKPEVVQATNAEADEEAKKEVVDSRAPKSVYEAEIVEKAEIQSEAEQIQSEKQEAINTKEISETTPADGAASHPTKRSKNLGFHDKSAPPDGGEVPLNESIKARMAEGDPKKAISDKPVNVIMLAGENRGASMQMQSKSSKREESIHIHRSYKTNPDESPEATTDAEESSEGKKSGDERSMEDQMMEAYVNNNAQGINNSIVFNSSIVEGNPGVHMVVNHLPKETVQLKDTTSGTETRRAEVKMSRAEKLTYQPTVRRRFLRGLLLETSDSDSEKPRRHGCRVDCQKGDRENNIDVS